MHEGAIAFNLQTDNHSAKNVGILFERLLFGKEIGGSVNFVNENYEKVKNILLINNSVNNIKE